MKKIQKLGKNLSKKEQKHLLGGTGTEYQTICTCPSGSQVSCPCGVSSANCFNIVYDECGGQPASSCKTASC